MSELKIVNSIYFHFHLFYFLDLGLVFSIISHVTVTNYHTSVTSHGHTIMCHIEYHRRFQNNNVILYTNSI